MKSHKQSGFTLVELAIVLVIIGLIIGGVLVGQDLIKAATIRAAQTDIEKTNAGATAFLSKYSGLPGDLLNAKAKEFGLINTVNGRSGSAGQGDGNGLIEGCSAGGLLVGCESMLFWVDLSTATLIPGKFNTYDGTSTGGYIASMTSSTVASYLPKQRLRDSANVFVLSSSGRNYYYLGAFTSNATGVPAAAASLTPGEARAIDEKLDDAFPTTGIVQSYTIATGVLTADPGAAVASTTCMDSLATSASRYNVIPANINNVNCQLLIRTSF